MPDSFKNQLIAIISFLQCLSKIPSPPSLLRENAGISETVKDDQLRRPSFEKLTKKKLTASKAAP